MNTAKKIAVIAIVAVLLGGAAYWFIFVQPDDNAGLIRVSGNIDVTDAGVSFKLAGRLDARRVDEGELVKQGRVIHLKRDLNRAEQLVESKAMSAEEYDHKLGPYEVAVAEEGAAEEQLKLVKEGPRDEQIAQARAALAQAKAESDLVEAGPRAEAIAQGRARVEQAKAAVKLAETRFGLLNKGKLLACGTQDEVKQLIRGAILEIRAREPRKASLVLRDKLVGDSVGLFGDRVHAVTNDPDRAGRESKAALPVAQVQLHKIRMIEPALEDVFVSLIEARERAADTRKVAN